MLELYRRLAARWNLLILSDEGNAYRGDVMSHWQGTPPAALFTVRGRVEAPHQVGTRRGRIESHSRPALRSAIAEITHRVRVDCVLIEYVELAGLVDQRTADSRWVLDLHDVLIDGNDRDADAHEAVLIDAFDAVVVTSAEDQRLLGGGQLVENGVSLKDLRQPPSSDDGVILFAGPFRYPPNVAGIRDFAANAFPLLVQWRPDVRLRILAGVEAKKMLRKLPELRHPQIDIVCCNQPMADELQKSAITINPIRKIRGSPLKVAESLAAGRVCVTTQEGARGFEQLHCPGLRVVDEMPTMANELARLLEDGDERRRLEATGPICMKNHDWNVLANRLHGILQGSPR